MKTAQPRHKFTVTYKTQSDEPMTMRVTATDFHTAQSLAYSRLGAKRIYALITNIAYAGKAN